MRTASDWLIEYGASHEHPTNKLLHWICVPPIVLSLLGILWSLPVPAAFTDSSPWHNWTTLATASAGESAREYASAAAAASVGQVIQAELCGTAGGTVSDHRVPRNDSTIGAQQ